MCTASPDYQPKYKHNNRDHHARLYCPGAIFQQSGNTWGGKSCFLLAFNNNLYSADPLGHNRMKGVENKQKTQDLPITFLLPTSRNLLFPLRKLIRNQDLLSAVLDVKNTALFCRVFPQIVLNTIMCLYTGHLHNTGQVNHCTHAPHISIWRCRTVPLSVHSGRHAR